MKWYDRLIFLTIFPLLIFMLISEPLMIKVHEHGHGEVCSKYGGHPGYFFNDSISIFFNDCGDFPCDYEFEEYSGMTLGGLTDCPNIENVDYKVYSEEFAMGGIDADINLQNILSSFPLTAHMGLYLKMDMTKHIAIYGSDFKGIDYLLTQDKYWLYIHQGAKNFWLMMFFVSIPWVYMWWTVIDYGLRWICNFKRYVR